MLIGIVLVVMLTMTNQVSSVWHYTSGKIEQFQEAREAFETITRRLSTATLNTYWDYDDPANPTRYVRQSELRFISGPTETIADNSRNGKHWPTHSVFFQAPLGVSEPGQPTLSGLYSLLNTRGYFVEFGDDSAVRPGIFDQSTKASRYRFRLYEMIQPANEFTLYNYTCGIDPLTGKPRNSTYTGREWFTGPLSQPDSTRPAHILAENVIALILLPHVATAEDSSGTQLAPDYVYDSTTTRPQAEFNPRNQLPPMVQVTMVVIDEPSARRLDRGTQMPDFGLSGLFQNASRMNGDLNTLESNLVKQRIQYRVFSTNVRIKGAKWSKEQQN
jgi:uncharacterized protein (TIGR02599 family)